MGQYYCENCERICESHDDGYHEIQSIYAKSPWACCEACLPDVIDLAAQRAAEVLIDGMSVEKARDLYA